MKCAKCGTDVADGVRQCPNCGLTNEFESPAPAQPKKVKPLVYVIAGLGAVALLALVVAVLASRGGKSVASAPPAMPGPGGNVMSAPPGEPSGGNLVAAPPAPPPSPAQTPAGVTRPKPPQHVLDYLNFVKKVEEHRQMLLRDTGDALTLVVAGQAQSLESLLDWLDDDKAGEVRDPLAGAKKEIARQYTNWVATVSYFDRTAAPAECREFSGAYREVVAREAKMIGEVANTLHKVDVTKSRDMQEAFRALLRMKNQPTLQSSIDEAADQADAKLAQLVSNYDMEKPFSVPRERKQSGSILGF